MFLLIHGQFSLIVASQEPCPIKRYSSQVFFVHPRPHLMITPVLILVLCHTCFLVHFSFSYICVLFTAVFYLCVYLAPSLAHFGQEIEFVSWFCFTDLTNCTLNFTHSLISISQLAFQTIVCSHLSWGPLAFIS